jgi:hypothetical protein
MKLIVNEGSKNTASCSKGNRKFHIEGNVYFLAEDVAFWLFSFKFC